MASYTSSLRSHTLVAEGLIHEQLKATCIEQVLVLFKEFRASHTSSLDLIHE